MPLTLHPEPSRRPYRIHHGRTARITGAVLLAHASVVWLALNHLKAATTRGDIDNVIMASVIMDAPAPPAPQPQPKVQPRPQPQPRPVVQAQPTPVVTQAPPSEAAPMVAPTPPAPVAAPVAAGNMRPSTQAIPAPAQVVQPSSDADYLNNPAPAYPRMSRRLGEQGTVIVRVFINTEGRAEKAEIHTSSGYTRLDETALETVQRWRYAPGKRNGMVQAMWCNVPIRFVLN